jgi:hypothetical protein
VVAICCDPGLVASTPPRADVIGNTGTCDHQGACEDAGFVMNIGALPHAGMEGRPWRWERGDGGSCIRQGASCSGPRDAAHECNEFRAVPARGLHPAGCWMRRAGRRCLGCRALRGRFGTQAGMLALLFPARAASCDGAGGCVVRQARDAGATCVVSDDRGIRCGICGGGVARKQGCLRYGFDGRAGVGPGVLMRKFARSLLKYPCAPRCCRFCGWPGAREASISAVVSAEASNAARRPKALSRGAHRYFNRLLTKPPMWVRFPPGTFLQAPAAVRLALLRDHPISRCKTC